MFYTYHQNNSGGSFDFDDKAGISCYVIIEAENCDIANDRASAIGLYFDGAGDCQCCGNRWYLCDDTDGTVRPEIYGREMVPYSIYGPDTTFRRKWMGKKRPEGFIHYENKRIVPFWE